MNQDWNELLARYADGEVSAAERATVEQRLAASPECADVVHRWRALRRCAGRVAAAGAAPAGLDARVRDSLRQDTGFSGTRVYRLTTAFAAAAALLLLAVFWNRGSANPNVSRAGLLVAPERFVETYEECARKAQHEGVKLEGHCPIAAQALMRTMCRDYMVAVPDLRDAGYELIGICHCLAQENVRATHAFYRNQANPDRVVSVFSVDRCLNLNQCRKQECCKTKRHYEMARVNDVSIMHWEELGGHFAVAGDMETPALAELAAAIQIAAAK